MRENRLRTLWQEGKAAVNGWLAIPNGFSAETMAHQGWDSLTIDLQHGVVDYQAMVSMLQSISTTPTVPVVRVPWLEPGILMKALDAGAYGVICPMVNTREDAQKLVAYTHYAPRGTRSFGPVRASLYAGADYPAHANDTIVTFAMIETAAALDNLDAILSVEGLDAIYIGPSDLSLALGCTPTFDDLDPKAAEAVDHILARAQAHGVVAGIHNGTPEAALRRIAKGFRFTTVSSDARLMAAGAQQVIRAMRAAPAPAVSTTYGKPPDMKIGFIGLGIMGAPMALHLVDAGHQLFVHTHGKLPEGIAASSAVPCANAAQVTRHAEVIFLMVPDTPDVEAVLFGADGVASALQVGAGARKIVVDMSSISPMATKAFAQKVNAFGADYIDAPVSGGEVGAKAASLTIMCGGEPAVFEKVRPLLEKMGKNITLVGGNGDGQTTKVANQIIVALNIAAVGEALLFASKAGADPAKVRQALMGGFASSRILEVHGERMIKRTFAPGFRIRLHQKDLGLALQGARELGLSLPQTANAAQLMQACAANGMADLDHSALVKALELMGNHEVARG